MIRIPCAATTVQDMYADMTKAMATVMMRITEAAAVIQAAADTAKLLLFQFEPAGIELIVPAFLLQ